MKSISFIIFVLGCIILSFYLGEKFFGKNGTVLALVFMGITGSIAASIFIKVDKAVKDIITPQSVKNAKEKASLLDREKRYEEYRNELEKKKKEKEEYRRKKMIEWENRDRRYDDLPF